jgi:hypothetical protein
MGSKARINRRTAESDKESGGRDRFIEVQKQTGKKAQNFTLPYSHPRLGKKYRISSGLYI